MTAAGYPVIRCDGPGCDAEIGGYRGTTTVTEVRAQRRETGWHPRPKGRDICPNCWKAGRR